jgi:hypothetical protein
VTDRDVKPSNVLPELAVTCPICNAKPGERCASLVNGSRYMDAPHAHRRRLAEKASP